MGRGAWPIQYLNGPLTQGLSLRVFARPTVTPGKKHKAFSHAMARSVDSDEPHAPRHAWVISMG